MVRILGTTGHQWDVAHNVAAYCRGPPHLVDTTTEDGTYEAFASERLPQELDDVTQESSTTGTTR